MDAETSMIRLKSWIPVINECNRNTEYGKNEWCRRNGVNIRQFYYWQNKAHQYMADKLEAADSADRCLPEQDSKTDICFTDITPVVNQSATPAVMTDLSPSVPDIVIRIADCSIMINSEVDEKTLIKVLRTIRNA